MKKKIIRFSTSIIILALLTGLFALALPYLVNYFILPKICEQLPFANSKLSISKISPWSSRATVTLGDSDNDFFSLPGITLNYSPKRLVKGGINTLVMDGATLHLAMHNNKIELFGYKSPPPEQTKSQLKTPSLIMPVTVDTILIRNGTILIDRNNAENLQSSLNARFSFTFAKTTDNKKYIKSMQGKIRLDGDMPVLFTCKIEPFGDGHRLVFTVQTDDLPALLRLVGQHKNINLNSDLKITGTVDVHNLKTITAFNATLSLAKPSGNIAGIRFGDPAPSAPPVQITLLGDREKAHLSLKNLTITSPQKTSIDLEGTYLFLADTFRGKGQLRTIISPSPILLSFSGHKKNDASHLTCSIVGGPLHFGKGEFTVEQVAAEANLDNRDSTLSGAITVEIPRAIDNKDDIALHNVSLHMPIRFPLTKTPVQGSFTIKEIRYRSSNCGKINADISSSTKGFGITSIFTTPFIPSLQLSCTGTGKDATDFALSCTLPKTTINSDHFPAFITLPEDFKFTGLLAAKSNFSFAEKGSRGQLLLSLDNGDITFGKNHLTGITSRLVFPDLPTLASKPGQLCKVASLEFGKIKMNRAKIFFHIEDSHTLFLERSRISWCGGKVEGAGMRLTFPLKKLSTTLYCDRLSFTQLLNQFGIEETEGQGSLNGKLPISISNKEISFDDGFLFSTPGNGGIIRFNSTEQLKQGLPDIGKTAYLDYSLKAMENFSYNWAKLSFNSEGDDLLVSMQLDGKPAKPLPFGYKDGYIVPQDGGAGLDRPIQFNINFRLPLQDMFKFGSNIQPIMENM